MHGGTSIKHELRFAFCRRATLGWDSAIDLPSDFQTCPNYQQLPKVVADYYQSTIHYDLFTIVNAITTELNPNPEITIINGNGKIATSH